MIFPQLWAERADDGNLSIDDFEDNNVSSQEEFATGLAQSTDQLFEEPPTDVETWNSGDFQDFSLGGEETSVYPEGAAADSDGRLLDVRRQSARPRGVRPRPPSRIDHWGAFMSD